MNTALPRSKVIRASSSANWVTLGGAIVPTQAAASPSASAAAGLSTVIAPVRSTIVPPP